MVFSLLCWTLVFASLCLCDASNDDCSLHAPVVTPPRLVVRYGDPASANCTVERTNATEEVNWETSQGTVTGDGWTRTWQLDSVTEWNMRPQCYSTLAVSDRQCTSYLEFTVYQLPPNVSLSIVSSGEAVDTAVEGGDYDLRCEFQDVACVHQKLAVTFYRGQSVLHTQQRTSAAHRPSLEDVDETWNITLGDQDHAQEFWCSVGVDLEKDGLRKVDSERITATVLFSPRILKRSGQTVSITRTQGESLELDCSASANPAPVYTWTRPQHSPANGSAIFTIDHVALSDWGNYSCVAGNARGNDYIIYQLQVDVDLLPIIAGVVAAALVVVMVTGCLVYCLHYRQTRTGGYNLMSFFSSRHGPSNHVAQPHGGLGQSPV